MKDTVLVWKKARNTLHYSPKRAVPANFIVVSLLSAAKLEPKGSIADWDDQVNNLTPCLIFPSQLRYPNFNPAQNPD